MRNIGWLVLVLVGFFSLKIGLRQDSFDQNVRSMASVHERAQKIRDLASSALSPDNYENLKVIDGALKNSQVKNTRAPQSVNPALITP